MLVQPQFAVQGMREVRRIVAANGWALLVTDGADGLAAAHLPCLLDPEHDPGGDAAELVVIGHSARADPVARELERRREVLLVFQGPHGYISAAWYEARPYVPTWNYTAVHITGTRDPLPRGEGFAVLEHTVEHFEAARATPWRLAGEARDYAHRIAAGTVPFRLRATGIAAKAKLSQDKPPVLRDRVIAQLERPGPYQSTRLADDMRNAGTS